MNRIPLHRSTLVFLSLLFCLNSLAAGGECRIRYAGKTVSRPTTPGEIFEFAPTAP